MSKKFHPARLYNRYRVKIRMRDRLYGGVPRNEDILEGNIRRRIGIEDEQTDAIVEQAKEQLLEVAVEPTVENPTGVIYTDGDVRVWLDRYGIYSVELPKRPNR